MKSPVYHSSIEGAQHGGKGLDGFLEFACRHDAMGAQPSNFMLENGKGGFLKASEIRDKFGERGLRMDGFSLHCPTWVLLTAWTESMTIRPFIPANIAGSSSAAIEAWAENYILRFLDLMAELRVKHLPMFWGTAFGLEVASGFPWGFWKGPGYDLIQEGEERFVRLTEKIRDHANRNGQFLCHEIHPGTAAQCSHDFLRLVDICDGDSCLAVNFDPSHFWQGESWLDCLMAVGDRVHAAHIKNNVVIPGMPLRMMEPAWPKRGMRFVDLGTGDINMQRYAEALMTVGYPQRYCEVTGASSAPLVVEAESGHMDLDVCSASGIAFVNDHLCWLPAQGSFEEGMGDAGKA